MTAELVERAIEAAKLRHTQVPRSVRKARGIVHTPAELAQYGVGRIDALLRERLGCEAGIADRKVCALDPALGTGVWLAALLDRLHTGAESGPELLGFDVDGESIDDARSLLSPRAERASTRLVLCEANTLSLEDPWGASRADKLRVILGNPPWGARSSSRGLALSDAWLREFRSDAEGTSLGERRSGVLSDDYVRFFRWALEQARRAPQGCIVCFATNSSFLDGPVHRGMREALVRAFDHLEVLDLGGNALRGNDGVRDENVFGVRVGACLTIALRLPGRPERSALVSYAQLKGSAASKLERLRDAVACEAHTFETRAPQFRFIPQSPRAQLNESTSFSLAEAFPFHREGVQTNHDALVTDVDRDALCARLEGLARGELAFPRRLASQADAIRVRVRAALDASDTQVLVSLAYRPLDDRQLFALAPLCHRPRPDLARAVAQSRLSLLSARKDRGNGLWNLFGVTRCLADACYLSTRSSCRTRVFPSHAPNGAVNLDRALLARLCACAEADLTVEDVIAYCIGVFSAESFRREQDQALHQDYPVLPLPPRPLAFEALRSAGQAWIAGFVDPIPSEPEDVLTGPLHHSEEGVLSFGDRRVGQVSPEMWAFSVGDFPVLPRLTLDRSDVSYGRIRTAFQRVQMCATAAALAEAAYRATRPVR